jgi:hypothetical protein
MSGQPIGRCVAFRRTVFPGREVLTTLEIWLLSAPFVSIAKHFFKTASAGPTDQDEAGDSVSKLRTAWRACLEHTGA